MKKIAKQVFVLVGLPLMLTVATPVSTACRDCGPMPGYSSPPTSSECSDLFNWCMCDCTASTGGGPCYSACSSWVQGFGCS